MTSRSLEGRGTFYLAAAAVLAGVLLAMSCGDTKVKPEPDPDPGFSGEAEPGVVQTPPADAAQVTVTLTEWAVQPANLSVPAGKVYFLANNAGQKAHELVVIKTDKAPDQLPFEDGRVPENAVNIIGEIEPFKNGTQASSTFDLASGNYVLICNVLEKEDDGTQESHYGKGMHVALTVE